MFFRKLKKKLKEAIEGYENQTIDWKEKTDRATDAKAEFDTEKEKTEKLNFELEQSITNSKLKDVLRTLEFNKLKPSRILVNESEFEKFSHNRDVVKFKEGLQIYDLSLEKSKSKRLFVVEVKKKWKLRLWKN